MDIRFATQFTSLLNQLAAAIADAPHGEEFAWSKPIIDSLASFATLLRVQTPIRYGERTMQANGVQVKHPCVQIWSPFGDPNSKDFELIGHDGARPALSPTSRKDIIHVLSLWREYIKSVIVGGPVIQDHSENRVKRIVCDVSTALPRTADASPDVDPTLSKQAARRKAVATRYPELASEKNPDGSAVYPSQEAIIVKIMAEQDVSKRTLQEDLKFLRMRHLLPGVQAGRKPRQITNRMYAVNPTRELRK
ncbi:MAG TPA: hypothetical protein VIL86_09880 [Tepidisphaeraceae bacterium]|jgi:hypothetical protein